MNIVAIGAHYDDIELGCGGTLHRYSTAEHNTYGIVICIPDYNLRDAATAIREGSEAASIIGYQPISLYKETRRIEFTTDFVKEIESHLKSLEADIILTHWIGDVHQDHSTVARTVISAARHYPRILMFRTNCYRSTMDFRGNYYVPLTQEDIDIKSNAVIAHKSEYDKRGREWLDFFIQQNRASGYEIGREYAEVYEVVKWLEF